MFCGNIMRPILVGTRLLKAHGTFHSWSARSWSSINRSPSGLNLKLTENAQTVHVRFLFTRDGSRVMFGKDSKIVQKYYMKDKIPIGKYELVYRCTFPNYVLMCQAGNFFMYILIAFSIIGTALTAAGAVKSEEKLANSDQNAEEAAQAFTAVEDDKLENLFHRFVRHWKEGDRELARKKEAAQAQVEGMRFPKLEDLETEAGIGTFLALTGAMVALMYTIMKLQQRLPMRLYSSKAGQTIGVFYGHIFPGITTQKQFATGALTRAPTSRWLPSTSVFQDPAGRKIILFEKMFRFPVDFNVLTGMQNNYTPYDEEEHGTKVAQSPQIPKSPKRS